MATNILERLSRFGHFSGGVIEESELGKQGQVKLKEIALKFYNGMQTIRSDTRLSAEGHSAEIKKAAKEALAEIDKLYGFTLKVIEENLAKLKQEFSLVSPVEEDVTSTLREIEIRGFIQKLDASARFETFQTAIEKSDELTFRSFINAPAFLNLLNEKTIEHGRELWAERQNPKRAVELKNVTHACEVLTENFGEVYQAIGEAGQVVDDSLRARLQNLTKTALDTAAKSYDPHRLAEQVVDTAGNPMPAQNKVMNM